MQSIIPHGPGNNHLLIFIVFLFGVSTIGFILFSRTPQTTTNGCPVCPACPSCNGGVSVSRDGQPYAPMPFIKREQDELMAKVKRHQVKLAHYLPWYLYETTYECMMGEDRIGFAADGGKWMCGFPKLQNVPKCIVYSMGSNGQHDFEDFMMLHTECEIHTFDMDDFSRVFNGTRVHFHKSKIGDGTGGTQSISYWMKELGHDHIDVFKIDIENGEFPAFEELSKHYPKPWIGQLLIEIHILGVDYAKLPEAKKYEYVDKTVHILEQIENLGLVQFHREENPNGGACEFSFGNLIPRPPFH